VIHGTVWAVDEIVACYGVPVRLRAADRESFAALLGRLPLSWRRSRARRAGRTYSLVAKQTGRSAFYDEDGVEQFSHRDLDKLLTWFETTVRLYVAERTRLRTFVHAGAVGWRGRAIVLPGRPEAGKTTLTAALVRAGATYLSDEFAPLDDRGRAHPYPKALWVAGRPASKTTRVPVEELGGVQEHRSLPVGMVVFTNHGARAWRPRPISPGRAIMELLKHTVSTQQYPDRTLMRLERAVTSTALLKGARGEAEETAPLILARLDAELERRARSGGGF
jgi:hypothetical protein